MKKKTVSRAQFAADAAVSVQMVGRYIAAGLPARPDGRIELAAGRAWLKANIEGRAGGPAKETLNDARRRKETALASLRQLELAEREKKLIDAAATRKAMADVGRQVRDSVLGIPDRLSALLAAEPDQKRIHVLLTQELSHELEGLANAIGRI